ncbi:MULTISPECIES: AbrB family transcriptional regulator [unclassified Pseudomonas]|uniref:AbrB family transcriptional regulator n=1 Tax=unclassified Pseudomonas TaxID=196821 RepID=UPI002AC8E0B0|nr:MULTISPECIES: AbrB family transcriptional regulator [unclassified Pseudomonas]MEB0041461.1 AbrB family transcriptional regulator [Pseudomonas sp. MH10]MEB0121930.1 AbrB family transcriptional regulator [Pseudomonas sp. CCI1.2]WPX64451.1 AbrB family transcriptional regulator [Pseudomonas sp. MH10]
MSRVSDFSLHTQPIYVQWLGLIALAGASGQLLKYWNIPAALFLGPMLVAIAFGVCGASIRLHKQAFRIGQGFVGMLVAHAMTVSVLATVAHSWHFMLFATVLTILLSSVVGLVLVRYAGFDGSTAAWGTSPGAASAMVAMSEESGADSRVVATMQYVRVVCVVMLGALVSHLIGADTGVAVAQVSAAVSLGSDWLSIALSVLAIVVGVGLSSRIPAGALLLPLLIGSALQLSGLLQINLPHWLLAFAYGAIGCYIGLRFDRPAVLYVWRRLPAMILGSLLLILLCSLSAWLLAEWMNKDFLSVYLATSPGGLDSMAIIAMDTHSDVGFVLAMQTLRLFGVIVSGGFFARQIIRLTEKKTAAVSVTH